MKSLIVALAISTSLIPARGTKEKKPIPTTKAPAPTQVGNFIFKPDSKWISAPNTPMVKASLAHTKKTGPVVKFYHFGQGQGGGVQANLKRWKGQFQGSPKFSSSEKTFGKQKVTLVTINGTYLSGPPFARKKTPIPNQTLLGAIIPHPSGDVFLKMTGATKDLEKISSDFEKLVSSASPTLPKKSSLKNK